MFGVGWTEMLLIGVVALIVIGPKDLPVVMSRLGKAIAQIRRLGAEFQREINKTTGLDQITDLRRSITEPLKQTAAEITREFNKTTSTGATVPSGVIAPKDPFAESVVEEIQAKVGMTPVLPAAPLTAPVMTGPSVPGGAPAESPGPAETIPPVAKPVRKTRAKKVVAEGAGVAPTQPVTETPTPAAAARPARKRTPKPKAEA